MDKFKVVVFGVFTDNTLILHYVRDESKIRDMVLGILSRDMSLKFSDENSLIDYVKNKFKDSHPMFVNASHEDKDKICLEYLNKQVDDTVKRININSCAEGSINYECLEMTEEEFENPSGELMSPYAFEYLEDGETAKRNKYSFINPITNELIIQ